MGHNNKLVKYFIGEYHKSADSLLDFLISPTFKFSTDGGPELTFQQYAERKEVLRAYVKFEFGTPETEDDVCFTADLKLTVRQDRAPNAYGTGIFQVLVVKNLIERVDVLYDAATRENNNFHAAIRNLIDAQNSVMPEDSAEIKRSASR